MKNIHHPRVLQSSRVGRYFVLLLLLNASVFGQAAKAGPSPLAMTMGKSVLSRNVIAVVIGNKDYERGTPAVDYALNDAQAFRDFLVNVFGIDKKDITYIENAGLVDFRTQFGSVEDFSRSKIFRAASMRSSPADLIVYYSGHGAPATAGQSKGTGFLVPVDADIQSIQDSGYAIDTLMANIEAMRSKRAINRSWIVFDACFSGQSGKGEFLLKNVSGLTIVPSAPKSVPKSSVLMFASSGEEFASWHSDEKHGLFTFFLLKGLSGEADSDENGEIAITELDTYLRSQVPRFANGLNGQEQTPQVISGGEIEGFLTLGKAKGEFLQAIETGWIELKSLPAGARVALNGKETFLEVDNTRTPRLRPGDHTVSITAPYVRDYVETVAVSAGEGAPLVFKGKPIGILELEGSPSGIQIEVSAGGGVLASPAKPLEYKLEAGNYVVRAKPSDDIDWSWQEKIVMTAGSTFRLSIPPEAYARSISWEIRTEKENAATLERRLDASLSAQKKIRPITTAGFVTGGVTGIAAGVLYFLGRSAMDSYRNATTVSDVDTSRAMLELYNASLIISASAAVAGFGLGGVLLAVTPKPARIEAQVQASIDRIKRLETRRLIERIE